MHKHVCYVARQNYGNKKDHKVCRCICGETRKNPNYGKGTHQ